MDNNILGTYVNGNTIVAIYKDGTKERYIKSGEIPAPEFPESIDLKITNKCDISCQFCAEGSTPDGADACLDDSLLDSIPPYTELAIGGGNPLKHPCLLEFLVSSLGDSFRWLNQTLFHKLLASSADRFRA